MKNKALYFLLVIFFIFVFVIFYRGLNNSNLYTPKIDEKNIPEFSSKTFFKKRYVNSKDIFNKNKFYILNIWASWCVPCRSEHPLLMKLSRNQSVKLIGFNYKDNLDNAKKFINELGNPYSQILIDSDGILSVEFGAYGVPETFLIDKNKNIIKKFIGPINKEIVKEIKIIIK